MIISVTKNAADNLLIQTHALDSPATGIGFSNIYSLYLAIRSKNYLLEKRNKAQDSENQLVIFIITSQYTKKEF